MAEDIIARYRLELDKLRGDVGELKKQFGIVEKAAEDTSKNSSASFNKLGSTLASVGAGILAAFSVQKIIAFGEECVRAFQEAEKNARKLQSAVSANGGLQADFERLLKQSEELQQVSIFSDDDIQKAQTMALQFGLTSDAVEDLMPSILDFASATGQELNEAMQSVILGIQGSERALKKYGIEIDSQATRQQNFKSIMDQLNAKFKGQAQIISETSEGALARFRNNFDNLKESIGETLIPLADAAVTAANAFVKMAEVPLSEKLEQEQADFRAARVEVLALAVGTDERTKAVKALQQEYPEFLGNLNAETATNEQLRDALEKVNNQYIFKIAIAKGKEELTPILEDEAEAALAASDAQRVLAGEIDKVIQQALKYPSANNQRIASDLEYLPVLEQARLLAEGRVKFDAISNSSLVNLAKAYDTAKDTQVEYSNATIKADDAQKEFNKTVSNLKSIFQINDDAKKGNKPTGLEGLTDEEKARIAAAAKARREAAEKQAKEEAEMRKDLAEKELKQDEDNVQKEIATRKAGLLDLNLTEKGMATAMTQLELFELQSRLQNYKDYGKEVGTILNAIADKQLQLKKIQSTPEEFHPNREDFDKIKKFYDDAKELENDRKKAYADAAKELANTSFELALTFNQINQDRITEAMAQNDAAASKEEEDLKFQFDQRIIGQDEYEKKLQAIKDRREGNEKALNDRMRKLKNRQALFEKAAAIFDIGLKTRQAIMDIQAKWAAYPPIAAGLTILAVAIAAGQLATVLALQPPAAHTGEKYVRRKPGDGHGYNLKSNETVRTLLEGERVVDPEKNRRFWPVFEAIEEGKFDQYVFHKHITPYLMAQQRKSEAQRQSQLAGSMVSALMAAENSDVPLTDKEFYKIWKKGIRINNLSELSPGNFSNPYRR